MLPGNSPSNALRPAYVLPTRSRTEKKTQAIRDDWDADDDDDDDDGSETATTTTLPQQTPDTDVGLNERDGNVDMWHEANVRAPMPEVVINPSSTGHSTIAPPAAALRPQLRILKRPSQSQSPSNSTSSTLPNQSTLAQREAQYLEARNRIFGVNNTPPTSEMATEQSSGPAATADSQHSIPRQQPVVTVLRDPLGPPSQPISDQNGNRPERGFGICRRGKN
ncbi:hypothetical protein EDD16DRAFT_1549681 [Pisolithus croceorrhizus]|nr:hypothetical protein EDD16DRAFT_1549681 [Pisolithus croceorrhizus]KAI6165200.1 hypothetical protein EDD17DRAFT_273121 [Pisolithus thermaeus]